MKNEKKISVLEKAVQMLENGFEYDWGNCQTCNCGIVAQAMGIESDLIKKTLTGEPTWSEVLVCKVTNIEIEKIRTLFFESGFSETDMPELEYLSNREVLTKIGTASYNNGNSFLRYLRAWIELLREEDEKEARDFSDKEAEIIRQSLYKVVRVDNSIFKQVENLVMQ